MKSLRKSKGYTIVETMIFLAVSTALFGSAMALVGDQQDRAEFRYGIQELNSQMRDISNDVATGFYDSSSELSCNGRLNNNNQAPIVTTGTAESGQSKDCIYVGRVLHFAPSDHSTDFENDQVYRVYSIVGKRVVRETPGNNYRDTASIAEAKPVLVSPTSRDVVIPSGIQVRWVRENGTNRNTAAFGFFTNFAQFVDSSKLLESNARNIELISLPTMGLNNPESTVANRLGSIDSNNGDNGISMCLEGFGYRVVLGVGTDASEHVDDLDIQRGSC